MRVIFLIVLISSGPIVTAQDSDGHIIYRFLDTLIVDSTSDISLAFPQYLMKQGLKDGKVLFEQQFQNKNVPLSLFYDFNEISILIEFDQTGLMMQKFNVKLPGELKGQSFSFDYDGSVMSTFNDFRELNGEETIYNTHNGQAYIICDYVEGLKEGYCKTYVDGKVARIEEYQRDSLNGIYQMFHPNGSIAQQGYFKDNNSIGKLITYDESGRIVRIVRFENGEVIDNKTFSEE